MNTHAACTSKAAVHRNTPLLRVFQCLLFSFFKKEKDAYKHQKGGKTWGAMQTPSLTSHNRKSPLSTSVGQFFDFGPNTHWRVRHGI
jgi:hypothetical protein